MQAILRYIRHNLIKENKIRNYFLYGVGEIVLVVIGILIAIQVNNWNEKQKRRIELDNIYKTIVTDLRTDTSTLTKIINFHIEKDSLLNKLLLDEFTPSYLSSINEENFLNCRSCRGLIANYQPFRMQTKGYQLLKNFPEFDMVKSDSISSRLIQFYIIGESFFPTVLKDISDITTQNIQLYEQQDWYVDWAKRKYNRASIEFFHQNQTYKNKAATYQIHVTNNYLRGLKFYKDGAERILEALENELD